MNFLTAAAEQGGVMSPIVMVVYIIGLVGFMYFFMIRPQKKQQKQHQELLLAVAVGDVVLTSSGFIGEIIDMTDDTVIVEFGNNKNCRIPMQKSSIVKVEKQED